jgi:hypothetical protein
MTLHFRQCFSIDLIASGRWRQAQRKKNRSRLSCRTTPASGGAGDRRSRTQHDFRLDRSGTTNTGQIRPEQTRKGSHSPRIQGLRVRPSSSAGFLASTPLGCAWMDHSLLLERRTNDVLTSLPEQRVIFEKSRISVRSSVCRSFAFDPP